MLLATFVAFVLCFAAAGFYLGRYERLGNRADRRAALRLTAIGLLNIFAHALISAVWSAV